jgi:hypothetical protein
MPRRNAQQSAPDAQLKIRAPHERGQRPAWLRAVGADKNTAQHSFDGGVITLPARMGPKLFEVVPSLFPIPVNK